MVQCGVSWCGESWCGESWCYQSLAWSDVVMSHGALAGCDGPWCGVVWCDESGVLVCDESCFVVMACVWVVMIPVARRSVGRALTVSLSWPSLDQPSVQLTAVPSTLSYPTPGLSMDIPHPSKLVRNFILLLLLLLSSFLFVFLFLSLFLLLFPVALLVVRSCNIARGRGFDSRPVPRQIFCRVMKSWIPVD